MEKINPSIKEEMAEPVVSEDNYDSSMNSPNLELTVEEYNFGLIFKDELVEPLVNDGPVERNEPFAQKEYFERNEPVVKDDYFERNESVVKETHFDQNESIIKKEHFDRNKTIIKEESYDTNFHEKSGTNVISRKVITAFDAKLCGTPDSTSPLSSGVDVIEINNGVRSVTFLPEGSEFGPYPDRSSTAVRLSKGEVDWTSSIRESCGKEQHNIEAVRREGQIYYRTVTDIQPSTELVASTVTKNKDASSLVTDTRDESLHSVRNFNELSGLLCHNKCHTNGETHQYEESWKQIDNPFDIWNQGQIQQQETRNQTDEFSSPADQHVQHSQQLTGAGPHKCPVCGKCFSRKTGLKKHQRVHTGEKPYKCLVCGKCFSNQSYLKEHQLYHTGEKPHKCPVCGKCFTQNGGLRKHYLSHTGEKPHKCSECGKCFSQSGSLQKHQQSHTGEKPHICSECGKCFSYKDSLKEHQLLHTGEKPHKCEQCGKFFTHKGALKRHQQMHNNEKRFTCNECDKMFSQKCNLKQHQMMHADVKLYKCEKCDKSYRKKASLRKHEQIHAEDTQM